VRRRELVLDVRQLGDVHDAVHEIVRRQDDLRRIGVVDGGGVRIVAELPLVELALPIAVRRSELELRREVAPHVGAGQPRLEGDREIQRGIAQRSVVEFS
jgi:hypothetical protein